MAWPMTWRANICRYNCGGGAVVEAAVVHITASSFSANHGTGLIVKAVKLVLDDSVVSNNNHKGITILVVTWRSFVSAWDANYHAATFSNPASRRTPMVLDTSQLAGIEAFQRALFPFLEKDGATLFAIDRCQVLDNGETGIVVDVRRQDTYRRAGSEKMIVTGLERLDGLQRNAMALSVGMHPLHSTQSTMLADTATLISGHTTAGILSTYIAVMLGYVHILRSEGTGVLLVSGHLSWRGLSPVFPYPWLTPVEMLGYTVLLANWNCPLNGENDHSQLALSL